MTYRQLQAMRFVLDRLSAGGGLPSTREIKSGLGLSSMSAAHRLRRGLVDRGLIVSQDPPVITAKVFKGFTFTPEGGMCRVF